jgi:hypothetical protein
MISFKTLANNLAVVYAFVANVDLRPLASTTTTVLNKSSTFVVTKSLHLSLVSVHPPAHVSMLFAILRLTMEMVVVFTLLSTVPHLQMAVPSTIVLFQEARQEPVVLPIPLLVHLLIANGVLGPLGLLARWLVVLEPKPKVALKIKLLPMVVLLVLDPPPTLKLVLFHPAALSLANFLHGPNGLPLVLNVALETLLVTEMLLLLNLVVVRLAQPINIKPNSAQLAFLSIALVTTPQLVVFALDLTRTTLQSEPTTSQSMLLVLLVCHVLTLIEPSGLFLVPPLK